MQCLSGTLSLLVAKVLPAQPFFLRAKRRRPPATSSIVSLLNYIKLAQPQKARAKLFKPPSAAVPTLFILLPSQVLVGIVITWDPTQTQPPHLHLHPLLLLAHHPLRHLMYHRSRTWSLRNPRPNRWLRNCSSTAPPSTLDHLISTCPLVRKYELAARCSELLQLFDSATSRSLDCSMASCSHHSRPEQRERGCPPVAFLCRK